MKENKKKLTQLFQIFTTFMKIGIFTFGGGDDSAYSKRNCC